MLRIVVQTCDCGMAANIGGSVESSVKTFDVDMPELEAHLREYEDAKERAKDTKLPTYWHRCVIGAEVLPNNTGVGRPASGRTTPPDGSGFLESKGE